MKKYALALPIVLAALVSLNACGGGKGSNAQSTASASSAAGASESGSPSARAGAIPDCGAVKPVWVNLNSKAYHEPGDPYYGKTKHGEYLCPSQATAQGFHAAGGARRHGHHRKGSEPQNDG